VGLGPNDSLVAENSGLVVNQALGVPLGGAGRAIAVVLPQDGLEVREWPHGEAIGPPIAVRRIQGSTLIGTVDVAGTSRLLAHRADFGVLHVLELPFLGPLGAGPVVPSQAAYSLPPGPLEAYVGQLPGGGPDGRPAAIVDGFLLPGLAGGDAATPIGALAGSQPIGLVGPDRSWLAVQHSGLPRAATDPAGGRLAQPLFLGGEVALAPLDAAATPEVDHGAFEPPTDRAVALEDGVTGIGSDGLTAEVHAPPGSHVYISPPDDDRDPSPEIVGATGELDIHVAPAGATADSNAEVTMTVATPAGHAYVSRWFLRLFEETPTLNAQASTPLGSTAVTVAGWTVPSAEVEVGGKPVALDHDGRFSTRVDLPPWPTAVTVTARDPIGNEADIVVTGVGLFDYRGLPWIPIALVLIGAVAVGLILRVPTTRLSNRPASDDGVLEELDPADRL